MKNRILFIILLSTVLVNGQELAESIVNIPDFSFRQVILNHSSVDTNNDGLIQLSEAQAYTGGFYLDIDFVGPIFSLEGIEAFTNLTRLELVNQPLSHPIDISHNTALKHLDYDYFFGHGQTVNTSNNINLETLICKKNDLNFLDVTNNPNLMRLICEQNLLEELDVSNNSNLIELNYSTNHVSEIDLSNNLNLENLNCAGNNIETLNISNNTKLDKLNYSYNPISEIDLSSIIDLHRLYCGHTQFTEIDLTEVPNLLELDCQYLNLHDLDCSDVPQLELLNCSTCYLESLDVSALSDLKELYASRNNFVTLDLSNNLLLKKLYCSFSPNLSEIDVSNNTQLENISLADTPLTYINLSQNTYLERVYFDNCTLLEQLDIINGNNEEIEKFWFDDCDSLKCILVDDAEYSDTYWHTIPDTATFVESQEECDALEIEEQELVYISFYPNPTTGILHFGSIQQDQVVLEIINVMGKTVATYSLSASQQDIDISTFSKGIYFVRFKGKVNATQIVIKE